MHDHPTSEWIHLWTRKPMAPHPGYYAVADAFVGGLDSLIDGGFLRELVAVYDDDTCSVYGRRDSVRNLERQVLDMIRNDPKSILQFRKAFLRKSRELLKFCSSIPDEPETLPDAELCRWYDEYERYYREAYVFGEPVAWLISDALSDELLDSIDRNDIRSEGLTHADILEALTAEDSLSPTELEELEFLSLAGYARHRTGERDGVPGIFRESLEEDIEIRERLGSHADKWRWIPCDSDATPWDEDYLFRRLAETLIRPVGAIRAETDRIRSRAGIVRARRNRILRENRIDRYHRRLFETLRHAKFLFTRRKEEFAKAHLLLRPLLSETFRRAGLDYATGRYLLAEEIRSVLRRGALPDSAEIRSRKISSVLHSVSPGTHRFLPFEERDRILREIHAAEKTGHIIEP